MVALAAAVADRSRTIIRFLSTHDTDHSFSHDRYSSSLCQLSHKRHFLLARRHASVELGGP